MTIFAQTGRDGSERSGAGRGGRPAGGIPHWLSSKTDKSPVRRWIELRYRARCKYLFINKIPPRDQLHDFKWNNIIFFWSFRHRIFHSELGGSTQAGFHMIGKWTVLKSLLGSMSESGRDIFSFTPTISIFCFNNVYFSYNAGEKVQFYPRRICFN